MEEQVKGIITYLQSFYHENENELNDSELGKTKSYYPIIFRMYKEMSEIFKDIKITKQLDKNYSKEESSNNYIGFNYIVEDHTYAENIIKYKIINFYSEILYLIYHNTELIDERENYFIVMVDHYKEIKKELNKEEYKIFKLLLNFKLGILTNNNKELEEEVRDVIFSFYKSIIDKDKLKDLIYIRFNELYVSNTIEGKKLIEEVLSSYLLEYDIETYHSGFFVAKHKYFLFNEEPYVKGYKKK